MLPKLLPEMKRANNTRRIATTFVKVFSAEFGCIKAVRTLMIKLTLLC